MKPLIDYLNGMTRAEQIDFAARCKTTVGYLRKAVCINQRLGAGLCIAIERESQGMVRCEALRDDVDWAYLRSPVGRETELEAAY